jgi:hypothetical protein
MAIIATPTNTYGLLNQLLTVMAKDFKCFF